MATYNTPIALAEVNAAVDRVGAGNAAAPSPPVPDTYNGAAVAVDLARPSDWTNDWGLIAVDGGVFNLRRSLEWILYVSMGKLAVLAAITQEQVSTAIPYLRVAIARWNIYKIMTYAGVTPTFRQTDIAPAIPNAGVPARLARELYMILTTGDVMLALLADVGQFVLLSFIANAIHREQNEGHSWYTEAALVPSSPTAKIIAIAGRLKDRFRDFMLTFGHCGNHHLSDAALSAIGSVLSGSNEVICPAAVLQYAGEDIQGKSLAEVFPVPESAKGRYPAGILGKAAIIVGLQMANAMVVDMSTRVKIEGITAVTVNLTRVTDAITATALRHETLLLIGTIVGRILAFVHGYCVTRKLIETDDYKAFDSHAKRFQSEKAAGAAVGSAVANVTPHEDAVGGAIAAAINKLAEALAATAAVAVATDANGRPIQFVTNMVAHDATKVKTTVGRDAMSKFMAMQMGAKGKKEGGEMFYDADGGD